MSQRLTTLVRGSNDLALVDYVVLHLGKTIPLDKPVPSYVRQPRLAALQRKFALLWPVIGELVAEVRQQELTQLRRDREEFLRDKVQSLRALAREGPKRLREQLRDTSPNGRLDALRAVALSRVHLEDALIERLDDRDRDVRRAAHQALVRLARGTDFGPKARAPKRERVRAARRWSAWLALQAGGTAGPGPRSIPDLASDKVARLSTEESAIQRLAAELLDAPRARQEGVLARLRDTKGESYTGALTEAIPQLEEPLLSKARAALVERLMRMSAATLREFLKDEDAEARRAAALACARKEAREHVPDLLALLEDPEPPVVQAARSALKGLTGKDYGPQPDANRTHRILAVAAWKAWWRMHEKRAGAPGKPNARRGR